MQVENIIWLIQNSQTTSNREKNKVWYGTKEICLNLYIWRYSPIRYTLYTYCARNEILLHFCFVCAHDLCLENDIQVGADEMSLYIDERKHNQPKMSTNRLARKVESSKICKFCLNPSENDGIILLFGTFSNELNIVKIIGQHFWFKVRITNLRLTHSHRWSSIFSCSLNQLIRFAMQFAQNVGTKSKRFICSIQTYVLSKINCWPTPIKPLLQHNHNIRISLI